MRRPEFLDQLLNGLHFADRNSVDPYTALKLWNPREAEAVYWQDLGLYRENGYSLFGLQRAMQAQGRTGEAAGFAERQRKAFAKADVTLTTSRY